MPVKVERAPCLIILLAAIMPILQRSPDNQQQPCILAKTLSAPALAGLTCTDHGAAVQAGTIQKLNASLCKANQESANHAAALLLPFIYRQCTSSCCSSAGYCADQCQHSQRIDVTTAKRGFVSITAGCASQAVLGHGRILSRLSGLSRTAIGKRFWCSSIPRLVSDSFQAAV